MSEAKKWIVAGLGAVVLACAHGAREDAVDYTVYAGSPETWTHVTNEVACLYLHDDLTIGAGARLWLYSKDPTNSKVLLPAEQGEDVTLSFVDNSDIEDKAGSIYTDAYIGQYGGKGKITLGGGYNLGGPTRVWLYDTAEPGDEGFVDFLEIADGGKIRIGNWYLYTTSHPVRIRLHGKSGFWSRTFVDEWFTLSSNVKLFLHGDDGGEIIFAHDTNDGNSRDHHLINGNSGARLVTTGACDVVFADNDAHVGKRRLNIMRSASWYDWAHSGDTVIRGALTVCTKNNDVLPHGQRTGRIRLESPNNKTPTLDLCGTTQTLNGVVGLASTAMVTNSSTTACGVILLGTRNEDTEFSAHTVSEGVRVFKAGTGNLVVSNCVMPHLDVKGGEMVVAKPSSVSAFSVSGAVVRINGTLDCETLAATNTTFVCEGGSISCNSSASGDGNVIIYPSNGRTNQFICAANITGCEFVKEGPSYFTCEPPADAHGQPLRVKGGTLRVGGTPCTNPYWRIIVKESLGTHEYPMPDGSTIPVTLAVGTIGLFTDGGLDIIGTLSAATTGSAISGLSANRAVSAKVPFYWNNATYTSIYGAAYGVTDKNNPIGNGANYRSLDYAFGNANGAASNTYDTVDINSWWGGLLYTNCTLVANDSSTWETIGWRVPSGSSAACSYNLAFATNLGNNEMQMKSWELQSSVDGVTWETMDERSGQKSAGDSPKRFFYNNHIPYLFSAKSNEWHFATFGTIRVDAGAVLDLSEIPPANIAVNALAVDLTAGAGTIKRFVPAAGGTLDILNPPAGAAPGGKLRSRVVLPLAVTEVSSESNLESWQVKVDGTRSPASRLVLRDGRLEVDTANGTLIVIQ